MPSKKVPRLAYGEKGGVFFFQDGSYNRFWQTKVLSLLTKNDPEVINNVRNKKLYNFLRRNISGPAMFSKCLNAMG